MDFFRVDLLLRKQEQFHRDFLWEWKGIIFIGFITEKNDNFTYYYSELLDKSDRKLKYTWPYVSKKNLCFTTIVHQLIRTELSWPNCLRFAVASVLLTQHSTLWLLLDSIIKKIQPYRRNRRVFWLLVAGSLGKEYIT